MFITKNLMLLKKNCYRISFMRRILAQREDINCCTKINICQAFYQIKMFKDSQDVTTFLTRFDLFNYLLMLFDFCNNLIFLLYLNYTLFDFLYCSVQIYLDNIFIYNNILYDCNFYVCRFF